MTELDIYQPPAIEPTRLVMTPQAAKELDDQLRACTRAVLREGTDYGTIPGAGERMVLFKSGAEKLLQWFGFAFTMECLDVERDDEGRKQGVTYRCGIVKRHPDGITAVAACEGYAGYDEAKFFQAAEQARFKAEARERKYAAQDKRVANPNKWQHIEDYRAPWNTVIKMAQKRALVGATIYATAGGGLFGTEEDAGPVADDGSTWYEQALEEALSFTTREAGDDLYVKAAYASRDGLCTPRQKDHIQSRIRQRQDKLKTVTVTDAGNLGRTHDSAPAAQDAGAAAGAAPGDPPGSDRHRKLVGACQAHFKRLGFTDDDKAERLWAAGKLAKADGLASLNDLDPDELSAVEKELARCRDRQRLEEVLAALGQEGGSGE